MKTIHWIIIIVAISGLFIFLYFSKRNNKDEKINQNNTTVSPVKKHPHVVPIKPTIITGMSKK